MRNFYIYSLLFFISTFYSRRITYIVKWYDKHCYIIILQHIAIEILVYLWKSAQIILNRIIIHSNFFQKLQWISKKYTSYNKLIKI